MKVELWVGADKELAELPTAVPGEQKRLSPVLTALPYLVTCTGPS